MVRTDRGRGGWSGGWADGRTVVTISISPSSILHPSFHPPFPFHLHCLDVDCHLSIQSPWPTILHVRVRRQTDAETKSSFPAALAGTESTCSIAIQKSCTVNFVRLRCDRHHPCGACSRRGLTNSCIYAQASSTPDAHRSVARRQDSLHGRISELESLVVTFMEGQSLPSLPTPKSPTRLELLPEIRGPNKSQNESASPADPGTLKLRESGTSYVQSVHWEAILAKIRGLKEDMVPDSKAAPGSHLFYGPNRHATRDEILAAVPPRPVVDRLMALHFDSHIVTPCQYIKPFFRPPAY